MKTRKRGGINELVLFTCSCPSCCSCSSPVFPSDPSSCSIRVRFASPTYVESVETSSGFSSSSLVASVWAVGVGSGVAKESTTGGATEGGLWWAAHFITVSPSCEVVGQFCPGHVKRLDSGSRSMLFLVPSAKTHFISGLQ